LSSIGAACEISYNITGQCIRTIIETNKQPGRFKLLWDGRNESGDTVSIGVYIYKIIAHGDNKKFVKVKKMIILKQ